MLGNRIKSPHRMWLISGLALVLLLAGCIAPDTSPITVNTPTATPLPPPVTVDLSTKTDSQGVLLQTVRITSSDGRITFALPNGSKLLDAKGRPVKSLTLTPYLPPTLPDGLAVGLAYKWDDSVTWGSITPSGAVTVLYDPLPSNPRVDPSHPTIGVWWTEKGVWAERSLAATVDPVAHTVNGAEGRFHDITIIYWYTDVTHSIIVPPPTPTPAG